LGIGSVSKSGILQTWARGRLDKWTCGRACRTRNKREVLVSITPEPLLESEKENKPELTEVVVVGREFRRDIEASVRNESTHMIGWPYPYHCRKRLYQTRKVSSV
jgi:hypothetical protein